MDIRLIVGDNEYTKQEALRPFIENDVRRLSGVEASDADVQELLFGQDMFSLTAQVVVIDEASQNSGVWEMLPKLLEKTDKQVVLLERHVDKRTKTYKWLKKYATIVECTLPKLTDSRTVVRWLLSIADKENIDLSVENAEIMVKRAHTEGGDGKPGIDQLLLYTALMQCVSYKAPITLALIDTVLAPSYRESSFDVMKCVLDGDIIRLQEMLYELRKQQDIYQLVGLLSVQFLQAYALINRGNRTTREVADICGIHPFAAAQMEKLIGNVSASRIKKGIEVLCDVDEAIKTGGTSDPWQKLEVGLYVCSIK